MIEVDKMLKGPGRRESAVQVVPDFEGKFGFGTSKHPIFMKLFPAV